MFFSKQENNQIKNASVITANKSNCSLLVRVETDDSDIAYTVAAYI